MRLNALSPEGSVGRGAREKRSQSSAAAPEESDATKRSLSRGLCRKGCARKGPRAPRRLRKSLNAIKRSLWKALLDTARAKWSESSGAAPEESQHH